MQECVGGLTVLFPASKLSVRNLEDPAQAHAAFVGKSALCSCRLALFFQCIYLAVDLLLGMNNWQGKVSLTAWGPHVSGCPSFQPCKARSGKLWAKPLVLLSLILDMFLILVPYLTVESDKNRRHKMQEKCSWTEPQVLTKHIPLTYTNLIPSKPGKIQLNSQSFYSLCRTIEA